MSVYTFSMADYHAVEKAEIKLDGITVLAGVNGSGKSTVSRCLYYIIKGTNEFDRYVDYDVLMAERSFMRRISRGATSLSTEGSYEFRNKLAIYERRLGDVEDMEARKSQGHIIIEGLISLLSDYVRNTREHSELPRIQSLFNFEPVEGEDFENYLAGLREKLEYEYDSLFEKGEVKKRERTLKDLLDVISHFSLWKDKTFCKFDLTEDGVSLVSEDKVKLPLSLENTVYYDTQDIYGAVNGYYTSDFGRLLREEHGDLPEEGRVVGTMMERMLGGTVSYDKDESSIFGDKTFNFHREDGLVFPLREAATGVISISYIYRLLKNGWLNSGTLLIIDEPEAHLHPQWIVEFARILIFLHKRLGVKILVSSHNPDMVSAIQSIAAKEEVLDKTRFYLSEQSESDRNKFVYKDLGQEIGEIFESFNIALSRIALYGE